MDDMTLKDLLIAAGYIVREINMLAGSSNATVVFMAKDKTTGEQSYVSLDSMFDQVLQEPLIQIGYDKPVIKYSNKDLYNKMYLPALELARDIEKLAEEDTEDEQN